MGHKLTPEQESEAVDLLLELLRDHVVEPRVVTPRRKLWQAEADRHNRRQARVGRRLARATADQLAAARKIAADQSAQTGKNYEKFMSGEYDHAFGVQCALAGMEYQEGRD